MTALTARGNEWMTAWGAASGYAGASHPHGSPAHPVPAGVAAALRNAQLELFCGHDHRAMTAIGLARRELAHQSDPVLARELAALDEAAWQVRHRYGSAAIATLDAARSRLTG